MSRTSLRAQSERAKALLSLIKGWGDSNLEYRIFFEPTRILRRENMQKTHRETKYLCSLRVFGPKGVPGSELVYVDSAGHDRPDRIGAELQQSFP